MNYGSIKEIFNAGITNMEVLRDKTQLTSGSDTITGVSWFTFKGKTASQIYASRYSAIGFGSNTEHLKVNRRSGMLYSLYREEGMLCGYRKFLKIRWLGYSSTTVNDAYKVEYDIILWDTGDISLRMISIPRIYNTGTYSISGSTTLSYTVSADAPDVTFIKSGDTFEIYNNIIEFDLPIRYLIRSNTTYYTIVNNALSEINVPVLTSSVFLNYGVREVPDTTLLSSLSSPEIIYWIDADIELEKGLTIKGTPILPQILNYEPIDMSGHSGIEKAELFYSGEVRVTITFDNGATWKYYNGSTWVIATTDSEGMIPSKVKMIPSSAWSEVVTSTAVRFKCALLSADSTAGSIYVRYR